MNYWIHRCAYMGGHEILDKEHKLTIGFADCANTPKMVAAIEKRDGKAFDRLYESVYGGDIWRARWSLWYFTCEMEAGDIVVVPRDGGFSVCKLKGAPLLSDRRSDADIGWEWKVETIVPYCAPREAYATTSLLSRMKCRQTTININGLGEDVEAALRRYRGKKPFSLPAELAAKCHELLDFNGSPDHFERLLLDYFERLGAKGEILPKNYGGKVGDCDVCAVFPALKLTISVQAKKHWGKTDEKAIIQIAEYAKANRKTTDDPNWAYVSWVVSFADDFTEKAKERAKAEDIVLVNGKDFCEMIVANGVGAVL